eukprot:g4862.t1 g4862   contig18:84223-89004(-)
MLVMWIYPDDPPSSDRDRICLETMLRSSTKQLRSFDSSSTALDLDAYTFIGNGTCKSSAYEEYDRITTRVASGAGAAEQCATFCGTIAYTTHVGIELHPGGDGEDTACNCLYEDDTTPVKKPNRDASFHGRGEIRWVGGNVASKCFKFEKHVEGMQLVGVGFPVDCQANDFITTSKLTTTTTPSSAKDCIEACKTSHYVYSQSQRDLGSLDESDNAGFAFLRGENGAPNECKCFVREENQCNMIMGDNDKSVGDLYSINASFRFSKFNTLGCTQRIFAAKYQCSDSNRPSSKPSSTPSQSHVPSTKPSSTPSLIPSSSPSSEPSAEPSSNPSDAPSESSQPSISAQPSISSAPSFSIQPSDSNRPSSKPSSTPSAVLSTKPSSTPSLIPSSSPSSEPSAEPSSNPSDAPSESSQPSISAQPSISSAPSFSIQPSDSNRPSSKPSSTPSAVLSTKPSSTPSLIPSSSPSSEPSAEPSSNPSDAPSVSLQPSSTPSRVPSAKPTSAPSHRPTLHPTTLPPTMMPTAVSLVLYELLLLIS